jgi:hypothetical protein
VAVCMNIAQLSLVICLMKCPVLCPATLVSSVEPGAQDAHEPNKLETYEKLTAAINRAKDSGDIKMLREIAEDPHGFILLQGWSDRRGKARIARI